MLWSPNENDTVISNEMSIENNWKIWILTHTQNCNLKKYDSGIWSIGIIKDPE